MEITAKSGKVVWSSNTVVTLTSGSSYTSPTTGYMSNGHGYVSGGGGGGSVSTTQKNVEKVRIALFDGGERNIEIDTDPMFSPGNIITIVYMNGWGVAYINQTTDRWHHNGFRLPFLQKLTIFALCVAVGYLAVKAAIIGLDIYGFFDIVTAIFYSAATIGLAVAAIRLARKKKSALRGSVVNLMHQHQKLYEKEITQSQEAWRKMLTEL